MMNNSTPPRTKEAPIVLVKAKESYKLWLFLYKNFPRVERYGIGYKIDLQFVELLENIFRASFLSVEKKTLGIDICISKLDILKFLLQTSWELKLIPTEKYSLLAHELEESGRMLGGWKKGIESKLPKATSGEHR